VVQHPIAPVVIVVGPSDDADDREVLAECPVIALGCVWFGVNEGWDLVIPNIRDELIHPTKHQMG
jgi:hypothetical protein